MRRERAGAFGRRVGGLAGRYPLPEARCELVRLEVGATHTSTGQELAISLDGATTYLPLGSRYTPKATAFVVVNAPPAP